MPPSDPSPLPTAKRQPAKKREKPIKQTQSSTTKKRALKPPPRSTTVPTRSHIDALSNRGELPFDLPSTGRRKEVKAVIFNPALTPSPFLDPQDMARRVKALKPSAGEAGRPR